MVAINNDAGGVNTKRVAFVPQANGWPRQFDFITGHTCIMIDIAGQQRDAEIHFFSDNVSINAKYQFIRKLMHLNSNTFIGFVEQLVAKFVSLDPNSAVIPETWMPETEMGKFLQDECGFAATALFNMDTEEDENSNFIPESHPYPLGIIVKEI